MRQIFFRARYRTFVVPLIVILNALIFFLWHIPSENMQHIMNENFLISYDALKSGRFWTLLTSEFSHNAFFHIFLNMYILMSFGSAVESVLGPKSFLKFYLTAAIVASLSHALASAYFLGAPELPALGASGAIAGVILVFSLVFPREKVFLLGFIPMPALVGALLFIGLDIWGLVEQAGGSGLPIGHGAHLGGAFTGVLYYLFFLRDSLRSIS